MEGVVNPLPRTVEEVFDDFKGRRAGLIQALTTGINSHLFQKIECLSVAQFIVFCSAALNVIKGGICVSTGFQVSLGSKPTRLSASELPEPALGINFARDGMQEKDWLSLVAVHSDSWLLSVAFYFGARFGFGKSERKRLLRNFWITILIMDFKLTKQPKQENSAHNSSKHKSGRKAPRQFESQGKPAKMSAPKEEDESVKEEEDEDEQGGTLCGACGDNYGTDEFWICCDLCERWFHGKCVKITPAKAEHIKRYKCPGCSNKRGRV
ncbi:hypothetical protein Leryth_017282 [Lithospermum erythrorhizon]|nr:hypothetical protein Leryth_017282 [Lithospermum erythrorhizon]